MGMDEAIAALREAKAGEADAPAAEEPAVEGAEDATGGDAEAAPADGQPESADDGAADGEPDAAGGDEGGEPGSDDGPETPPLELGADEPAPEAEAADPDESWEKRYKDLQAHKDRQLAEMQAKMEAYDKLLGDITGADEPDPEPEIRQPSYEELEAFVQAAPGDAFQQTMINAPHLMNTVIDMIGEIHGPEQRINAANAWVAAQQQMFQHQQQQAQQEQTAQQEAVQAQQQAIQDMAANYDDWDDLKIEVAQRINQIAADPQERDRMKRLYPTPYALMEATYHKVWRDKLAAQPPTPEPAPQPSFAETGKAKVDEPEPSYQEEKMAAFMKTGLLRKPQ